ncbi:uncharacterized protein N7443_006954 [Penicillium atrosanguineum]|uniref:uncharacterized protein n=1 Tax=Penicillium atrosanguineum TaxID=1132637 RepID=UPI002385D507|nr:uncharacterized protein N7443_006954 [Penicillium atrosanguineum]KAJ5298834.1 hypothetical protein N7443_006954 [Penicillium atrosanguineum]
MLHRRHTIERYHTNTCQWILELEKFQSWRSQSRGLLWIKGKPGVGKSTLMVFLYDKLKRLQGESPGIRLECFFSLGGLEMQHTMLGMLRSLLVQIFERDLTVRPQVREAYEQQCRLFGGGERKWEWPQVVLEELLAGAILASASRQHVTMFIDALDETGTESAQQLAAYFHQLIDRSEKTNAAVQICISCRHYPLMETARDMEIYVEQHNHEDIATYIKDILINTVVEDYPNEETRELLAEQCIHQANGSFLWARFAMHEIKNNISRGEPIDNIRRWLSKVPTRFEDVYDTKSAPSEHTDIESIFSMETASSWESSQPEIISIAISELVGLLLSDDQLMVLCSAAISKVGPEKFQRNFARMLKRYGWRLNEEASNQRQREAARFVRSSARWTAVEIRKKLMDNRSEPFFEKDSASTRLKSARVNEWIESHSGGHMDWSADTDESSAESDSADSESYEPNSLATLEEVKGFMMSTKAFFDLRQEFRLWLEGKRRDGHERPSEQLSDSSSAKSRQLDDVSESALLDGSSGDSSQRLKYADTPSEEILATRIGATQMTRLSSWWLWLMNSYAPPAAGYQRILYTCVGFPVITSFASR